MPLQKIDPLTFKENIFQKIGSEWFLLTAGNEENCNTMTAAWGGLGFLWGKNVATVYVRQSRYTYGFMEETDRFTLSFFGEGNQRDALAFCGSRSGRDVISLRHADCIKSRSMAALPLKKPNLSSPAKNSAVSHYCRKVSPIHRSWSIMPTMIITPCISAKS